MLSESSEEAHLTALRQVAQSAHLTQTVQNAAADTGSLLQLFHRDILFAVDGGTFQRFGGGTAQTLQRQKGRRTLPSSTTYLEPRLLPSSMGKNS